MTRYIRHLLGSTWCRWQSVTSLLPSANQQHPSVACQRRLTILGASLASRSGLSVKLLHGTGQQCCGTTGTSSKGAPVADDDEVGRPAITESLMSEGPGGASESADGDANGLDSLDIGKTYIPPATTDNLIFGGIPYYELPVIHIKATYNNTHINITDHTGRRSYTRTTCGAEGFKNAKKGTTIAAQTVGISAAAKALEKGLKTVRVIVKGIGPGRQASIKGLQMGGLDIVSITDNTPIPHNGARPRKARRL
ncbi:28S ribosomal protein S11, mitochondrial-like isoform X2 [Acanthaster planci]|nr:28S ribosomal protein S11, mitochondrial-like isoform X2 [Acanthaster planci]XP_022086894.1 28S ribosomal protein S11, mitochondrial-like isoform X2 [Acanthaster planci]XP_022086895.1 28S ribosomal protein S11, mitochondrial-like isoform X2 [Acanthaster planci]XP_022086896.1 28S ribosomal protein S11, mitochondrial-like isoform X2 [Acanthaster planci]XP_022086897.1 28S ribosomal protein S11, mitochondrial-like isoform X2 [Acanthaster planci]XP_022086898.1 28S ribosomal protein S11, mitochon